MLNVPAVVAPLVWAFVFVLVVALIYAALKWMEIALHPKLEQILIFLVCLIVVVMVLFWILGLFGFVQMPGATR